MKGQNKQRYCLRFAVAIILGLVSLSSLPNDASGQMQTEKKAGHWFASVSIDSAGILHVVVRLVAHGRYHHSLANYTFSPSEEGYNDIVRQFKGLRKG